MKTLTQSAYYNGSESQNVMPLNINATIRRDPLCSTRTPHWHLENYHMRAAPDYRGMVEFHTLDSDGRPIEGVEVALYSDCCEIATTNARGIAGIRVFDIIDPHTKMGKNIATVACDPADDIAGIGQPPGHPVIFEVTFKWGD